MASPATPPAHPFADLVGFDVDVDRAGHATSSVELQVAHHNPNGSAHGAVLFALVDTSMGGAAQSVLEEGRFCASIEVHLRFLRPVTAGRVTATTSVVKAGRRIVQLESQVTTSGGDGGEELLATATGSFAVLGG